MPAPQRAAVAHQTVTVAKALNQPSDGIVLASFASGTRQ
jgi:hypothetical protein